MKKLLFFITIIGLFSIFSGNLNAQQSLREPLTLSQKSDDGVLIAYPNPVRDYIVLKSKDSSLLIKQVTFFTILGVQVAEYRVNMNSAQIQLDQLKSGKYLMRYILSDNTQKVTQIIKQ